MLYELAAFVGRVLVAAAAVLVVAFVTGCVVELFGTRG